jgi:oligopeptide/dipeptide ABC transporter ATP-binding protein
MGINNNIILKVENLTKIFLTKKRLKIYAVDDVSFWLSQGKCLGIAGESGSGKSTLAKLIINLIEPTWGKIIFKGIDVLQFSSFKCRKLLKPMQIVFQNPYTSLNPRKSVYTTLSEAIKLSNNKLTSSQIIERIEELLSNVELSSEYISRYPHQLSGGERQRIAIARALAVCPELLILDEPVSSLDISTASAIINLLLDLQAKFKLSFVFISHDLRIISRIAEYVCIMFAGRILEFAKKDEIFKEPLHPYTKLLIESIPTLDGKLEIPPSLQEEILQEIKGCRFYSRCPIRERKCETNRPELIKVKNNHSVACFKPNS